MSGEGVSVERGCVWREGVCVCVWRECVCLCLHAIVCMGGRLGGHHGGVGAGVSGAPPTELRRWAGNREVLCNYGNRCPVHLEIAHHSLWGTGVQFRGWSSLV